MNFLLIPKAVSYKSLLVIFGRYNIKNLDILEISRAQLLIPINDTYFLFYILGMFSLDNSSQGCNTFKGLSGDF